MNPVLLYCVCAHVKHPHPTPTWSTFKTIPSEQLCLSAFAQLLCFYVFEVMIKIDAYCSADAPDERQRIGVQMEIWTVEVQDKGCKKVKKAFCQFP